MKLSVACSLYEPRGHENVILRIETREFCTNNRISEEAVLNEIGAMQRDARSTLFLQSQRFQSAIRELQSRAREAVNQAVHESSENMRQQYFENVKIRKIAKRAPGRR